MLMSLINVGARRELDLLQGREVVGARTLVAVYVHSTITLEVGNRVNGGVDRNLLGEKNAMSGSKEDVRAPA